MTLARFSITLALILVAIPGWGQESAYPPSYFLFSESTVLQADSADYADALAITAKAHAKHPKGNAWVTYRRLTGGPEETVRFLFPLNSMAELDGWVSNHQILAETLGSDRARIVRSDLDLAENSSESILSYSSKMSRPWPNFQAPRYAWTEEVTVAEGKMVEYAALVERMVRHFDEQEVDGYWVVYGNAIGGDGSSLLWFYGFDLFAEIDAWDSRLDSLAKSIGVEEAARLMAAMEAISQTTTSIWQMEPALSQFVGE